MSFSLKSSYPLEMFVPEFRAVSVFLDRRVSLFLGG